MKKLTFSSMAAARLRVNKRQYLSLVLGIFLSIFLVTTSFLGVQGLLLAQIEKTDRQMGKLDAYLLDDTRTSDEKLMASGLFSELGHVYVSAQVKNSSIYLGWYDKTAENHLYRTLLSGHMPKNAGEIAVEQGALLSIDHEKEWQVGDTLELSLLPIDGETEHRSFTLVGILQDQSAYLGMPNNFSTSEEFVKEFPAALISAQEAAFGSGRLAVHRTFLVEGGILGFAGLNQVYEGDNLNLSYGKFFGVSFAGHVDNQFGTYTLLWMMDESLMIPLTLGVLLAASLILSCCVGISGAMEGILSRRSEEIGILRAVGATKRQIKRMFGRESILLAIILSPISILLSIGAMWLVSIWMQDELILKLNPWLLIPIGILSLTLIFLSGYLPLRRCSNQMPMSVIRDTAVLRKVSHIRSSKQFRVQNLISKRMLRLNPGRQVGAIVLSALMLFSVACVSYGASIGVYAWAPDSPAFEIRVENGSSNIYVHFIDGEAMSDQSLAQINALPHVSGIVIERNIPAKILLPEKSNYLNEGIFAGQEEAIRKYLEVDGAVYECYIQTVVLDSETLANYKSWLEDGDIDINAVNAGREVIIAAPNIWSGVNEDGYTYSRRGPEQLDDSEVLKAENDCFYAGQQLPVYRLYTKTREYSDDPFANAQTEQTTVTVGAVLNDFKGSYWSTAVIITTEQGIQNMGLYANGMDYYRIYLDGEIDTPTEEKLVEQISAIAARSEAAEVVNLLESHRESQQNKQSILIVFGAITLVFMAVSVGMIVSSNTRRIQSDGRLIGMLRAVGAEERTILDIYTGQVTVSIVGGFVLTVFAFWFMNAIDFLYLDNAPILLGLAAMAVLAVISWVMCGIFLRLRIREIVNKSIIDNIREL